MMLMVRPMVQSTTLIAPEASIAISSQPNVSHNVPICGFASLGAVTAGA